MEDGRSVVSSIGIQELLRNEVRTVDQLVQEIDAVQIEDLTRVARRLVRPEKTVLAMVGPFDSPEPFMPALDF